MHILCIGAHPDDCDLSCGGTAALLAQRGHQVKFVSVTNGDRGHMDPSLVGDRRPLAARRLAEAQNAVAVFGGCYETLGVPDGEVYVTRELTEALIRVIRRWGAKAGEGPDLVLLNRPNDYHRDHRYTSQLVLDATYMLTVPLMCPDVRHLDRMPVFAYWFDGFREGGTFRPDVVVPLDSILDTKTTIVTKHVSQVFEWLPYNRGDLQNVPADEGGRWNYIHYRTQQQGHRIAEACRKMAPDRTPPDCRYAEAFQISEYGRQPSAEDLVRFFPVPTVV